MTIEIVEKDTAATREGEPTLRRTIGLWQMVLYGSGSMLGSGIYGLIGQAAHVVFPVDCVSHDAMLTIKRLCRQSGTPWSPLRSTGLAPFLAAIAPDAHICLPRTRETAS